MFLSRKLYPNQATDSLLPPLLSLPDNHTHVFPRPWGLASLLIAGPAPSTPPMPCLPDSSLATNLSADFQPTPTLGPFPVLLRESLQALHSRAHTAWNTLCPLLGTTSPPGPSQLRHRTPLPVCCHQMILPALRSGGNILRGPLQRPQLAPRAGHGGPCCDIAHPLLPLPTTTRFLRSDMTHLRASVRTSAP